MAIGSLIGFGLVFVLIAWTASAMAGLALTSAAGILRGRGSAAEKRAAALALVIPPLLGGIVAVSLAAHSALPGLLGGADHCDTHGAHLHLCLVHGGEWSSRAWAVSLIAALAAFVLVRVAQLGERMLRGRRQIRVVQRSSIQISGGTIPVFRAPSHRAFCFVSGIVRPRIFVSSALWDTSSMEEREAMLGHEQSHVANGDLWRSGLLSFCALFGAPLVAGECKRLWAEAAERLCDRLAADRAGDATPLASALVNLVRGPRLVVAPVVGMMSFLPKPESVKERVIAVLTQERTGQSLANKLIGGAAGLVSVATTATLLLADPLHHALETLFSRI